MADEGMRVNPDLLKAFCVKLFEKLEVPIEDAEITADNLIAADLRGISSHGVARLRRYVSGLEKGSMLARPDVQILNETPATALVDGGDGLGQPVSRRSMRMAIAKAKQVGAGFVTVRNSNHYGIAGYYSMMALEHDMIGFSMTNSAVLVVPTFGRNAMLGTNPISVAAPAGSERPFVLDMATSTVPRGKLEVYNRLEKPLPLGWATDEYGEPTSEAARVLDNFVKLAGGGLLPLGGAGELFGGHKGFGLALLVDILAGVLPGAGYANNIYLKDEQGKPRPANVGHFFGALRVDAFRPLDEFKASMDDIIHRLKNSPTAINQERIYIHGEKEYEMTEERERNGVLVHPKVVADLQAMASEFGVEYAL